jgi:Fe-Mn family superoxide dismutase
MFGAFRKHLERDEGVMTFELPPLPYARNALEPHISANTLDFHYGKHHQTYVTNLNNLTKDSPLADQPLESVIKASAGDPAKAGLFNNSAQVWNHTFYFESFSPSGKREPEGALADAITGTYGSFEAFREQFTKSAATLFGSGWAWLVKNSSGKLEILQESNAGNPLKKGHMPLLTCDVWEHAYYLDYQNRRPDYVQAFWNILDWSVIGKRF